MQFTSVKALPIYNIYNRRDIGILSPNCYAVYAATIDIKHVRTGRILQTFYL